MVNSDNLVVFAVPGLGPAMVDLMGQAGIRAQSAVSGPALAALLDDAWGIALVVVDIALLDAAQLARLQSPGAPSSLFLIGKGSPGVEAITLAPTVLGYIDLPIEAAALRDIVLAHLPAATPRDVADFSDRDSARLSSLGRDVERIARALADISSEASAETASNSVTAPVVRAIIKRRRDRERYFPAELFGDPAWDMMLDLIAAQLEGRNVSVSSLCIAASVPTTTALRWIRNLCDVNIFERNIDPEDARRGIITLSPESADLMLAYLASVRAAAVV